MNRTHRAWARLFVPSVLPAVLGAGDRIARAGDWLSPKPTGPCYWVNPGPGTFDDPSNWKPFAPGPGDVAAFPMLVPCGSFPFDDGCVSFAADAVSDRLVVTNRVSFDLGSRTYTLTAEVADAVLIDDLRGAPARLWLRNGVLAAHGLRIGQATLSIADDVAIVLTDTLRCSGVISGNGTIAGNVEALGNFFIAGSLGSFSIDGDITFVGEGPAGQPVAGNFGVGIADSAATPNAAFLDVSGTARLGGSLDIYPGLGDMVGMMNLPVGYQSLAIEAGAIVGEFDLVTAPVFGEIDRPDPRFWRVVYPDATQPLAATSQQVLFEVATNTDPFAGYANATQTTSVSGLPTAAATGDFNGDGRDDLAVAQADQDAPASAPGRLVIRLSLGFDEEGVLVWEDLPPVAVGADPSAIATGRFDADDDIDVVVTNRADGSVTVLSNDGGGALTVLHTVTLGNGDLQAPSDVAAAHFDAAPGGEAGGQLDLAVAAPGTNELYLFMNRGDGSFEVAPVVNTQAPITSIDPGDVDNPKSDPENAGTDLVGASAETDTVFAFPNLAGTFGTPISILVGARPVALEVIDLNGDGRDEVVTANAGDGTVTIAINSDFAFPTVVSLPLPGLEGATRSLAALDQDLDQDQDLLVLFDDQVGLTDVLFHFDNALTDGQLVVEEPEPEPVFDGSLFVVVGDLDGDLDEDALVVTGTPMVGLTGGGLFTSGSAVLRNNEFPADLNGDGAISLDDAHDLTRRWGPCKRGRCSGDFDNDGTVGFDDLLALVGAWRHERAQRAR